MEHHAYESGLGSVACVRMISWLDMTWSAKKMARLRAKLLQCCSTTAPAFMGTAVALTASLKYYLQVGPGGIKYENRLIFYYTNFSVVDQFFKKKTPVFATRYLRQLFTATWQFTVACKHYLGHRTPKYWEYSQYEQMSRIEPWRTAFTRSTYRCFATKMHYFSPTTGSMCGISARYIQIFLSLFHHVIINEIPGME